ncbi:hypothetical protein LINPERHAP2_LOCUS18498 [Linum perenne]
MPAAKARGNRSARILALEEKARLQKPQLRVVKLAIVHQQHQRQPKSKTEAASAKVSMMSTWVHLQFHRCCSTADGIHVSDVVQLLMEYFLIAAFLS